MSLPRPSRKLTQEDKSVPSLDPKKFRPSDVFVFEPRSDITVEELAHLLKVLYEPAIHFKSYLGLPDTVQRHFQPKV